MDDSFTPPIVPPGSTLILESSMYLRRGERQRKKGISCCRWCQGLTSLLPPHSEVVVGGAYTRQSATFLINQPSQKAIMGPRRQTMQSYEILYAPPTPVLTGRSCQSMGRIHRERDLCRFRSAARWSSSACRYWSSSHLIQRNVEEVCPRRANNKPPSTESFAPLSASSVNCL